MSKIISNLNDLKEFISTRPELKSKVEEAMETANIKDFDLSSNPIIDTVEIFGGEEIYPNEVFDSNDCPEEDSLFQDISIFFNLISHDFFVVKVKQRYMDGQPKTTLYYSEDFGRHIPGKEYFVRTFRRLEQNLENNTNPFEAEYVKLAAIIEDSSKLLGELKKEEELIKDMENKIPNAAKLLKSKISGTSTTLRDSKTKFEEIEHLRDTFNKKLSEKHSNA